MRFFQLLIVFFFLLSAVPSSAQELLLTQLDAKWKYKPDPKSQWTYSLGTKYRSVFYDSGDFDYSTNFLELNASPSYGINSNQAVSVRFAYRFKKLFDSNSFDEKRMTQQYNHNHKLNHLKLKGKLRIEQRFRERFTLRNRCAIAASFAINKHPDPLKQWFFTAETEALWSVAAQKVPVFDQRVTAVFEKPIIKKLTLKFKPQFRYLDYTHKKRTSWRLYSMLDYSL